VTGSATAASELPLDGVTVIDLSRMLPGAVLARQLVDLGARVIKVEEPGSGDPMRMVPPQVDGVGLGFAVMLRGAESVALDLRDPSDADRLRALVAAADVGVDSFRPGVLDQWRLAPERLCAEHPALIWCSMSSFGRLCEAAIRVGHDLNFMAESGLLRLTRESGHPAIQLVDVAGALLAATAILAALYRRERGGAGGLIDQPLAAASLPFLTWAWAEEALGEDTPVRHLLGGRCACYRTYVCGDGAEIALATLEPKFWIELTGLLGVPDLAAAGHDPGEAGSEAARRLAEVFGSRPRAHWLGLAREHGLPIGPVHDVAHARAEGVLEDAGLLETTPMPGAGELATPGPYHPSLGRTPRTPAPAVGEHTERVLQEFGVE
jgi:crotonobetainyl-CoA:carnitine CoA-transferase CaiB-like acyl-CoA transferase